MDDQHSRQEPGLANLLAVYLLDLRAEIENELRTLTRWQRQMEDYRSARHPEQSRQAYILMEQYAKALATSNLTIKTALGEAHRQLDLLRPDNLQPEPL